MLLDTVLREMPYWYEAKLAIYLTSSPGQGKTTTLSAAPALLSRHFNKSMGLVIINGGNLNEMDVQGYLVPRHNESYSESIFTRPPWWRTTEGKNLEDYDGCVVVVDEADKCPVEVKKILGEACESNRLGSHVLPEGCIVWMAGNRSSDRSGSTKELDHLINRRCEISVTVDLDGWTNWANRNGVLPLTIAFANANPQIVFESKVPDKQGPWCTPRSLVKADRLLAVKAKYNNGEVPLDPTTNETLAGIIGEGGQQQYINSIKLAQQMPKFEVIIADPMKAKVPEAPDAQMLVCFHLAHKVDDKSVEQVVKYVDRFPKEFAVTFARATIQRSPTLLPTKAFNAWCMRNASLVAVLNQLGK
jgi:hypothetical protein